MCNVWRARIYPKDFPFSIPNLLPSEKNFPSIFPIQNHHKNISITSPAKRLQFFFINFLLLNIKQIYFSGKMSGESVFVFSSNKFVFFVYENIFFWLASTQKNYAYTKQKNELWHIRKLNFKLISHYSMWIFFPVR